VNIGFLIRRLVDISILLLLLATAWRVFGVIHHPLAQMSSVTMVTPAVKAGDILQLPGVVWDAPRTAVLVVSSSCSSCNANLPFYRRMTALASSQLHVVALSNEPATAIGSWLRQNQVNLWNIYTVAEPLSHGLTLTPMVLVVNAEGHVTDLMMRRLDESDQDTVLERLRNPSALALDNSRRIREVSSGDVEVAKSQHQVQMLDVRSRERFQYGHRADARNVPSVELSIRAPIELDARIPVIVDCLQPGAVACHAAAWTLIDAGFDDVSLLIR
jgi:rhodanese-related sulfurtransferase